MAPEDTESTNELVQASKGSPSEQAAAQAILDLLSAEKHSNRALFWVTDNPESIVPFSFVELQRRISAEAQGDIAGHARRPTVVATSGGVLAGGGLVELVHAVLSTEASDFAQLVQVVASVVATLTGTALVAIGAKLDKHNTQLRNVAATAKTLTKAAEEVLEATWAAWPHLTSEEKADSLLTAARSLPPKELRALDATPESHQAQRLF